MKTTIRVPAKPHVAVYMKAAYGSPAQIPKKTLLYDVIESMLTNAVEQRYRGQLENHKDLFVQMPNSYAAYVIPDDKAHRIAMAMEKHFWSMALKFILEHLRTVPKSDKKQAIEAFYSQYQIREDQYSYDSFRRRLTREEVLNLNTRPPAPLKNRFRCVSNYDGRMIYLYVTKDNLSYRQVARLYNISKSSVEKIVNFHKKVFQLMS